jgi:hypothetical protein
MFAALKKFLVQEKIKWKEARIADIEVSRHEAFKMICQYKSEIISLKKQLAKVEDEHARSAI